MPFREKIAWISVATTALVWGIFFGALLLRPWAGSPPTHGFFGTFILAVIVQAALMIAASIVTAVAAPSEASAARDERDRAVARRSTALAYPVLVTGVLFAAATLHLGNGAVGMAYAIMGAIVVAELVHYGAQIAGYRSGWHG